MNRTPLNRRSRTPKCKTCKTKFEPKHLYDFFCSDNCLSEFAKKAAEKARKARERAVKKAEKESKAELKALKEKNKSHGEWEQHLEDKTREIVRLLDKGWDCISCGRPKSNFPFHASHRHAVGGNNSIRYNLFNQFLSCSQCNVHRSGNPDGYDAGLKSTFGEKILEYVKFTIVRENPIVKLSIPEIKEKIEICNQIIRELKAADKFFTAEERIEYRREYNNRIGIYKQ